MRKRRHGMAAGCAPGGFARFVCQCRCGMGGQCGVRVVACISAYVYTWICCRRARGPAHAHLRLRRHAMATGCAPGGFARFCVPMQVLEGVVGVVRAWRHACTHARIHGARVCYGHRVRARWVCAIVCSEAGAGWWSVFARCALARRAADDDSDAPFAGPPRPCLLYTSPSPRDRTRSRMPSSA